MAILMTYNKKLFLVAILATVVSVANTASATDNTKPLRTDNGTKKEIPMDLQTQNNNQTITLIKAEKPEDSAILTVQVRRPQVKLISNVVYQQVPMRGYENVAMKMDLLVPQQQTPMPAIVFVTGGGFINANKDNYIQERLQLAEQGYVTATIQYRVAPTVRFPAPLEDVKAAIRYLRAHADQFSINPEKIGIMGGSAGGYLAAMAGTSNGYHQFDKGDNLTYSSDVQAVVDLYGLSDLTKVGEGYDAHIQQLHMSSGATEALWVNGSPVFGGTDGGIMADPAATKAANPITYISERTPPFLLMHGDADTVVSPHQTERLHQALVAAGISSQRYVVKNATHGGVYWVQPEVMKIIIDFFDAQLKTPTN